MHRALPIAAIVALLGAFLLFLYLRQFEQTMSGGERVALLIATKPIQHGQVLTDDMLGVREVPMAYVEARSVKASERSKVTGVPMEQAINAQDVLMWTDLSIATKQRDLSSLVQFGNRAVTVRAGTGDETKGYALINPGDYVDVLTTTNDTRNNVESRSSAVLLQKVLVLAVGMDTTSTATTAANAKDDRGRPRDLVLTLSLKLQEAQLVALATENGRLSVALRNPEDQRVVEGIPDLSSAALLDSRARTEIQDVRRGAPRNAGPVKIQ